MSLISPDSDDPLPPDHIQQRYPKAAPAEERSSPDRGREQPAGDYEAARAAARRQAVQDPLQRRPD